MEKLVKKYDVAIIGWGKGGKTIAAKLGNTNLKVLVIEKDPKMYGGTCINVGCLPTKALTHLSKVLKETRKLGIKRDFELNKQAYAHAIKHKFDFVARLNKVNFANLDTKANVDLLLGDASFVDQNTLKVQSLDQEHLVQADKIIINTGAKSRDINLPGRNNPNVLLSDQILDLDVLPEKLLVIGAGFIGLEFATYFNNFGTKVTIAQNNNLFMPSEDESDAKAVLEQMQKQGIEFVFNANIEGFEESQNGVNVKINGELHNFDKVLVSVGRTPNYDGLNLEAAGVEVKNYAVAVNEKLQTSQSHIWAVGDVKGGAQFTYISLDDSRIVLPQILGKKVEYNLTNRTNVPFTSFIDPEYARTGLNEKQAKALNINYTVKMLPTAKIPKAHVIDELAGFSKVLIDENDYIIGATLFHYQAAEMINILSLAISKKLKYQELRDFIYTHPIFTESLNELLD